MRSLWLAIVLALLGSSLLAQAAPAPTVPAPSDAVMRDAIRRARVLLDSGVAARDPGALAALFAANATFIYGADTLRGRDAIEGFLSGALAAATWLDLRSSWERLDRCTDGMREIGGQFTVERTVPTSADTVVGGYSALWVMAPDGAARIGRLVVTARGAGRASGLAACGMTEFAAFARRRVFVNVPTPVAAGGWNTVGSLEGTMRARGYLRGDLIGAAGFYATSERSTPVTINVRWRPLRHWSVEGFLSLGGKEATVTGYRGADSSYLRASYDAHFGGLLVGYHWQFVRLAAGPVWIGNSWHARGLIVASDSLGFHPVGIRDSAHVTTHSLGVGAVLAVTYPVSPLVFIETRAELYRYVRVATPPLSRFPPAAVDDGSHTFSLGLGIAF